MSAPQRRSILLAAGSVLLLVMVCLGPARPAAATPAPFPVAAGTVILDTTLAVAVSDPTAAAALVLRTLTIDTTRAELRVFPDLLGQGAAVTLRSATAVTAPFAAYFILVDDQVRSNWEHPCRWVFVSPDGRMQVLAMRLPPDLYRRMPATAGNFSAGNRLGRLPAAGAPLRAASRDTFISWFIFNSQATAR